MDKDTETRFDAFEQILMAMMIATPGFDEAKFKGPIGVDAGQVSREQPEERAGR